MIIDTRLGYPCMAEEALACPHEPTCAPIPWLVRRDSNSKRFAVALLRILPLSRATPMKLPRYANGFLSLFVPAFPKQLFLLLEFN